ncbi:PREDICTED: uncharacterized protein LOC105561517, partial [Vollenhovia emeryi]|uniref:uncharacterized protein LOC105561517 n=1 Tax=Vollenhovia emeryi TaxID=411798 RepID=UPI0005F3DF5D
MVTSWGVVESLELLSDHLPIEVRLLQERRGGARERPVRWAARKLDQDRLVESLVAATWSQPGPLQSVEEEANRLQRIMTAACDNAMPRYKFDPRRAAYWWSEEIAEMRRSSVAARRAVQRARWRRNTPGEELDRLLEENRQKRQELKSAIRKAKEAAWDEMIRSLDTDPWGRPYKLVMNKLSTGALPAVETMQPGFLDEVVETLFPAGDPNRAPSREVAMGEEHQPWTEELNVCGAELIRAARKLKAGKAPGPDGIPGVAWKAALGELSG